MFMGCFLIVSQNNCKIPFRDKFVKKLQKKKNITEKQLMFQHKLKKKTKKNYRIKVYLRVFEFQ